MSLCEFLTNASQQHNWHLLPMKNRVAKKVLYLNHLPGYLFNKFVYAGKMIHVQVSEIVFISRLYTVL